jgi:hypothetical protein
MGFFVGQSRNVLSSAQKKLKESMQALNPKNLPDKIRNAMFEKLTRMLYKQAEFMMDKISERMEAIDKVTRPFYEKVNALGAHGPVSENQLWKALDSIEAAKNISDEEKSLLVTIFGQFVGAAKPKFVNATVVEEDSPDNPKSKPQLDASANH